MDHLGDWPANVLTFCQLRCRHGALNSSFHYLCIIEVHWCSRKPIGSQDEAALMALPLASSSYISDRLLGPATRCIKHHKTIGYPYQPWRIPSAPSACWAPVPWPQLRRPSENPVPSCHPWCPLQAETWKWAEKSEELGKSWNKKNSMGISGS